MTQEVWLNGAFIPADEAMVPVADRSYLMGDGVFETMRGYGGVIFLLERHLKRLRFGLTQTRINPRNTLEEAGMACEELMRRNGLEDARVRLTVSRGLPDGHNTMGDFSQPYLSNMLITAMPIPAAKSGKNKGWKLKTISLPTTGDSFPNVKFTSYGPNVLARGLAIDAGCDEALILNAKGRACEGAMSNLFWFKDGCLHTPSLKEGCLAGVTRELIIRLARDNKIPVAKKRGRMKRLYEADEIFMSASVQEIAPVRTINGNIIGAEFPGPMTVRIQELYRQTVQEYCASRKNTPQ
ncbi:aminotransferase class IV family protein [Candidatus Sumerlaeota bacterium]|nr:aminotransferase class IV family protein [Candidatus Sumerlaeota bacterium]